jgi:hypothetical protein
MRAAEAGNLGVVRALVEGGANVNAEACDEDLDRFLNDDEAETVGSSVTALLCAALKEHLDDFDLPRVPCSASRSARRPSRPQKRSRGGFRGGG